MTLTPEILCGVGARSLTPEMKSARQRQLFASITSALNDGAVTAGEIYQHIATIGDNGADVDEWERASNLYTRSDGKLDIADNAWASRGEDGTWVHAWVLVPNQEESMCGVCGERAGACGTCT